MAQAQIKPAKAGGKDRYPPLVSDPVDSLAEQVGRYVIAEVRQYRMPAESDRKKRNSIAADMQRLEAEIGCLISKALQSSLSSQTAEGRAIRMGLIAKLASAELGNLPLHQPPRSPMADTLLTTAQAAEQLEVSRPYVSMLCDQGKLGEVVMTEGGHRRIRASAVQTYLSARTKQHAGAPSPREAAEAAGLYDFPEGHFKNVVRETDPPILAPRAKASRKPRA